MNQMVKDKEKDNNNNNKSSNSLVFGRWPQTKIIFVQPMRVGPRRAHGKIAPAHLIYGVLSLA